jgi:predicted neuraminidase
MNVTRLATLSLSATLLFAATHGRDPANDPPKVVTAPAGEYADTARQFQGVPGLERTKGGRLWATWYSGGKDEGPHNFVLLATSADDGRTWEKPQLAIDPEWMVRAFDPCLWIDPEGRMWLFWAQSVGQWDGRGGVWTIVTSDPESPHPTWSAPRHIANGVMLNKPTVLSSGEWLLPVAGWRNIRADIRAAELGEPGETFVHDIGSERGSNVFISADKLNTLRFLGQAQVPRTQYDEHMVVERRDGRLLMMVRTDSGIGESVSPDRGRTWAAGTASRLHHVPSRFFIRRLRSGRLLVVRNDPPSGVGRSHLRANLSDDEGATWYGDLLLDVRKDVSYPDGVEAEDGKIYIVYDHERKGAKEILMAVFTEQDVEDGKLSSPGSRLMSPVNVAGK